MSDAPDDIRADIMKAMQDAPQLGAEVEQPSQMGAPDPAPNKTEEQLSNPAPERSRSEDGKFAKAAAVKDAIPDPAVQAAQPSPPQTLKAPDSWSAEMKAKFGTLPPEAQAYISQRESEMNKKFTAQDEERSFGRRVKETIGPFMATILQEGGTPEQAIAELFRTAMVLRSPSPDVRRQALQAIAQQFNVDLGVPLQQPGMQPQQGVSPIAVQQLVQAELSNWHQRQEQSGLQAEIEAFSKAPGHEHYESVQPYMAALLSNGQATDLQDAYDKATWANPEIRSTLMVAQARDAEQKRITEAQAKADAAKRVAVSVKGGPGGTQPANGAIQDLSLRDELMANLQAATAGRV